MVNLYLWEYANSEIRTSVILKLFNHHRKNNIYLLIIHSVQFFAIDKKRALVDVITHSCRHRLSHRESIPHSLYSSRVPLIKPPLLAVVPPVILTGEEVDLFVAMPRESCVDLSNPGAEVQSEWVVAAIDRMRA